MIDGLALDYAGTRLAARLAWRPDETLWRRLHAARDLRALLEAASSAPVGAYLGGVDPLHDADAIDIALRTQWRARVDELRRMAPAPWRAALDWCARLADLSAVTHLWSAAPPRWMRDDPVLGPYAEPSLSATARRATLQQGPLGPIGRALALADDARMQTLATGGLRRAATPNAADIDPTLPPALRGWLAHWPTLWPALSAAAREALTAWRDEVLAHRRRFAALPVDDTQTARDRLAARAAARLRADPAQPLALFAALTVIALDLERLRAECLLRALDAALPAPMEAAS